MKEYMTQYMESVRFCGFTASELLKAIKNLQNKISISIDK